MKKSLSILLILVMLLGMLTACAQTTAPAETTETKTETTEPASETTETDATEAEIEAAAEDAEQEAEETDQLYIAAVAAEVGIPYFTTMQWAPWMQRRITTLSSTGPVLLSGTLASSRPSSTALWPQTLTL